MDSTQLAKGLGWFSLALGAAELLAPQWIGSIAGVGDQDNVMRTFGARGIAAGFGILGRERPVAGLWSRVAGDVMDAAALARVARTRSRSGQVTDGENRKLAVALAIVGGIGLVDFLCARRLTSRARRTRDSRGGGFDGDDFSGIGRYGSGIDGASGRYPHVGD